jgi:hypothetical protein
VCVCVGGGGGGGADRRFEVNFWVDLYQCNIPLNCDSKRVGDANYGYATVVLKTCNFLCFNSESVTIQVHTHYTIISVC